MRIVAQRVRRGRVSVDGRSVAEIQTGLVILLGIGPEDTEEKTRALAHKLALMRIFQDEQGKMNLSVLDVHGEAIVVSQFTLYADIRKGNRPSFIGAALPGQARPLVNSFAEFMTAEGVPTQTGEFGAHMLVEIDNDGPVTIVLQG
jgi:D-tyrosyl-tRNA(Tyr) deacylase